eukprot:TRINITY_DN24398_c0_g1_i1.p1 TRINITY_DN24398_c0_g1~~TRINITY_DN24398_c0_g1_i1.p1  ORF type:complete len:409 (+),score=38.95 TRINITY_DN24398_c0_g1_i1:133-1359(+)
MLLQRLGPKNGKIFNRLKLFSGFCDGWSLWGDIIGTETSPDSYCQWQQSKQSSVSACALQVEGQQTFSDNPAVYTPAYINVQMRDGRQTKEKLVLLSEYLRQVQLPEDAEVAVKLLINRDNSHLFSPKSRFVENLSPLRAELEVSIKGEYFPGTINQILTVKGEALNMFELLSKVILVLKDCHEEHYQQLSKEKGRNIEKKFFLQSILPTKVVAAIFRKASSRKQIQDSTGCSIYYEDANTTMMGVIDKRVVLTNNDTQGILQALVLMVSEAYQNPSYQRFVKEPIFVHTQYQWFGNMYRFMPQHYFLQNAVYHVTMKHERNKLQLILRDKGDELEKFCEYEYVEGSSYLKLQGSFIEVIKGQALLLERIQSLKDHQFDDSSESEESQGQSAGQQEDSYDSYNFSDNQ